MKKLRLGDTSIELTSFGLGGSGIASLYRPTSREDASTAFEKAWEMGVRYFDTAPFYGYGLSERRMGDFLRMHPKEEWALSTKVGRLLKRGAASGAGDNFLSANMPFHAAYDYSYDGAMRSIEDSFQRLGLDKIDIVYIHDIDHETHSDEDQPKYFKEAMNGAYKALEKLRSEGLIQAIGIGVNEWEVCDAALEHGDFDCFLLAGRFTLLEQTALESFLPKCQARNVGIIIGGVFNSGLLVDPSAENATYKYASVLNNIRERALSIQKICHKYQVPLAAAALQYPLKHPAVVNILSGARNGKEVGEIGRWLHWDIPSVLWEELDQEGFVVKF